MASDLSSFLKDELANTLEQLLSKKVSIDSVSDLNVAAIEDSQCIDIVAKFDFANISSTWNFYVPTQTATKFEYFMLGGMGDLKEHIDDEITDAVSEIISNVCGSFCTAVNAQGFPDVTSIKSDMSGFSIKDCNSIDSEHKYIFDLTLDDEKLPIFVVFDDVILSFLTQITGGATTGPAAVAAPVASMPASSIEPSNMGVASMLSDDSAENLQLLFDIKLKLSVRLGTKQFLLKDILRWDIGEIIELEQMVNEPLEVLVNGVKIGEGEAVIVEGKFGLKIKSIGNNSTRLGQLGL